MDDDKYRKIFAPFLTGDTVGEDHVAFCPRHEDPTTSKKPSAQINFDKGIWWCFAGCFPERKEATLKSLAAVLKKRIDGGEIKLSGHNHESAGNTNKDVAVKKRRPIPTPGQVKSWQESLADMDEKRKWLTSERMLTDETIQAWEIGYSTYLHRYTMPVYSEGKLVDARCRSGSPDAQTDKYIWWRGGAVTPLFGTHMLDDDFRYITVMEGELDVILAWQMRIPAVTGTAGAGTWKDAWTPFFAGKEVFVCYDTDEAGMKGRGRVTRAVREVAKSVHWIDLDAMA